MQLQDSGINIVSGTSQPWQEEGTNQEPVAAHQPGDRWAILAEQYGGCGEAVLELVLS